MNRKGSVLALLVVASLLISLAGPPLSLADNPIEKGQKSSSTAGPALAANSTIAFLSNNLLRVYVGEQYSDTWEYQYGPGLWGESCWLEHFAVYLSGTGTIESERFTVDTPFTNPNGGSGTVSGVLHYGNIQVARRVTLPPGDARYLQIQYVIKNIGSSAANDLRFFETIDFDIPYTGDNIDDYGWYDSTTDYIGVKDDDAFRNGIASNIRSSKHGVDHYSAEMFEDWVDGQLNNANSYGPGDPAIGKQFDFGNLAPGSERQIILTVWFGDPSATREPAIDALALSDNRSAHHTESYTGATVLRRAQWFGVRATISGEYDERLHDIRWRVTDPSGNTSDLGLWRDGTDTTTTWSYRQSALADSYKDAEILIPSDAALGKYSFTAELYKNDGSSTIVLSRKTVADIYIIFNAWKAAADGPYDDDVYNPGFSAQELSHYVLGTLPGTTSTGLGMNYYPDGSPQQWTLNPPNAAVRILEVALADVKGVKSAESAMAALVDKSRWDGDFPLDPGDILEGRWGCNWWDLPCWASMRVNWQDTPNLLAAWDQSTDTHPTGQCMDFGGLVSALARSVGIPSRMLTTVDSYDPHNSTVWNFHVWDEVWINSVTDAAWSDADGTYEVGPTTKQHSFIQQEVSTSGEVYAYDAAADARINIRSQYNASPSAALRSSPSVAAPLVARVLTSAPAYDFGQDVAITVEIANTSDVTVTAELSVAVKGIEYYGLIDVHTFPLRSVTVSAHTVVREDFTFTQAQYTRNGSFRIIAAVGAASGTHDFSVNAGVSVALTAPALVNAGLPFEIGWTVQNLRQVEIGDVSAIVSFPWNVVGATNPESFTIPALPAGGTFTRTWQVTLPAPGVQELHAVVYSLNSGYDEAKAKIDVRGPSRLMASPLAPDSVARSSQFLVTGSAINTGGQTASNVQITLILPPGLSAAGPLTTAVGDMPAGASRSASWTVTALADGLRTVAVLASEPATGDESTATKLVSVYSYDHEIEITATPATVLPGNSSTVALVITNLGNAEDTVLLESSTDTPELAFSVYDAGVPIIDGPVIVPANGSRELSMVVTAPDAATGSITVNAISQLDPDAADSAQVLVSDVANFTALPLTGHPPLLVQFTRASTETVTGYLWSFGDGITSTEIAPLHGYFRGGSYTVTLTVNGAGGSNTMTKTNYIQVYTFDDVPPTHPSWLAIEAVKNAGVTAGCGGDPPNFCPDGLVKREEIAVFIDRALGWNPTPGVFPFGDMPDYWATPFAVTLWQHGVTAGCQAAGQPLRYCPLTVLSKAEIATMIRAASGWPAANPPQYIFADAGPGDWFTPHVEAFYAHTPGSQCGVDPGSGKLLFCPNSQVTRAYMAELLARAFHLGQ